MLHPLSTCFFPSDISFLFVNSGPITADTATPTHMSTPRDIWFAQSDTGPTRKSDETAVSYFVSVRLFPRCKFILNKVSELKFDWDKKSICHFVIKGLHVPHDDNIQEWWRQASKWVGLAITRVRNDRNTALKWAFFGKWWMDSQMRANFNDTLTSECAAH